MSKDMIFATPEAARAEVEYLVKIGQEKQAAEEAVQALEINGETWTAYKGSLKRFTPEKPVRPDVFTAFSLSGLVDFILADVDEIFMNGKDYMRHIVRVVDPWKVEILTPMTGYYRERFCVCECMALVPEIPFDSFMGIEDFQIMVQTRFENSANRELVLKLSGNLRSEQSGLIADDGVSQKITINRGVTSAGDVIVKNPVTLKPLRTFYEVEQPESPFILRFNEEGQAALFEGDGGKWKLEAVENIKNWLGQQLNECNVEVIA